MFGRNRRKATEHVVNAVRPLVAVRQNLSGIPAGFWRDEFVLGFMGFMIGFHATVTSGRTLSQEDKGYVLSDTFTALSNLNGQAISRDYVTLATAQPKHDDFEKGADHAAICAAASVGKMTETGQSYFEQAKEIAAASGSPNDIGVVVGALLKMLYFDELDRRFG